MEQGYVYSVAVDADSVVWGTGGGGSALRLAPIAGGAPTTAWHGGYVYAIALDGPRIYFSVGVSLKEGIWSVGKDGSNPKKLYAGHSTYTIALDDDSVYFSVEGDPGHVLKVPKTGGAPVVLGNIRADYELTTDTANVYAAAAHGGMHDANVVVFPKNGASHWVLASGGTVEGVALLGDRVAWTSYSDDTTPDGSLLIAPIAGGPTTTLGSGYQHPGYIVSRNGVLVWAEYWGQAVWRMHVP